VTVVLAGASGTPGGDLDAGKAKLGAGPDPSYREPTTSRTN
jgi:hypothetical protein